MARAMPFMPNLEAGIFEEYGYLTQILSGPLGHEQRRGMRAVPQRLLELTVAAASAAEAARFWALVHRGQNDQWYAPFWGDGVMLTANAASGASAISCQTQDVPWGGYILLWHSNLEAEVLPVASASAGTVNTSGGIVRAQGYPAGSRAVPCELAYLSEVIKADPAVAGLVLAQLQFLLMAAA